MGQVLLEKQEELDVCVPSLVFFFWGGASAARGVGGVGSGHVMLMHK